MSVASLKDGQLQLSELTISNEKYVGASGYVAASSNFSSSVNGTSFVTSTANIGKGSTTGEAVLQIGLPEGPFSNLSIGTSTGNPLTIGSAAAVEGTLTATTLLLDNTNTTPVSIDTNNGNSIVLKSATVSIFTTNPTTGVTVGFGNLTVNSSNQLLWNGSVIS
jgi:hypothetical protein